MSLVKKAMKSGLAVTLFNVARREAAKPQNQQRAKEMLAKARQRRAAR